MVKCINWSYYTRRGVFSDNNTPAIAPLNPHSALTALSAVNYTHVHSYSGGGKCGTVFSPLRMSKQQHTAKLQLLLFHVTEDIYPKTPSVDTGAHCGPGYSFGYFLLFSGVVPLAEEKRMTFRRCSCLIYCELHAHSGRLARIGRLLLYNFSV